MATPKKPAEAKRPTAAELRESYAYASSKVRAAHMDAFNAYRKEWLADRGYDWSPIPTAEEKAAAQVRELLATYPSILDALATD
jgi:hypothetical protein